MRDVLCLGDSHSGVLRRGFEAHGWRAHGGILQTGKKLEGDSLSVEGGTLRFTAPRAQERYEAALASARVSSIRDVDMPIVSTFGFNTHRFMKTMNDITVNPAETDKQFISQAVFERIVAAGRTRALEFYQHLAGKTVFAVHSPQRAQPDAFQLSIVADDIFANWLRDLGINVIDVRPQTVDDQNRLRPEFWTDELADNAHGNEKYSAIVVAEIERALAEREAQAAE